MRSLLFLLLQVIFSGTFDDDHIHVIWLFYNFEICEKYVCSVGTGRKSLVSFTVTKIHWMNEIELDWN